MKVSNSVKFQLENFDKLTLNCDVDCSLGTIYDFSCALNAFVLQKMEEKKPVAQPPQENIEFTEV